MLEIYGIAAYTAIAIAQVTNISCILRSLPQMKLKETSQIDLAIILPY